jgi:hypothetical protein
MGLRPFTCSAAGLLCAAALTLSLSACAAENASAETALSLQGGATATATVAAAATSQRTVKLTSVRTTNYTKGTLQVTGTLNPAPAAGTRVALQRWSPTKKIWEEIGNSKTSGAKVTVSSNQPGSIRTYRLAIGPQSPYAAAASAGRRYAHYVWRGVFKRGLLATGGKSNPQFNVVPPSEDPRRSNAELLADRTGQVWGDINTAGCNWIKTWLGNITDGTVRTSLRSGTKVLGSVDEKQETETWLNRRLLGSTRTRLQVVDLKSGYGPQVAVDATLLCTN